MISADILRKLADAKLSSEQLEIVLTVIAEMMQAEEVRKSRQRERKARSRSLSRDSHGTVTGQSRDNRSNKTPARAGGFVNLKPLEGNGLVRDQNSLSETSSDDHVDKPKRLRKRVDYPEAFETFWRGYPTDALMSKKAAGQVWTRLSEADREAAITSLPIFRAYCAGKPDYRTVHACRYLSQERYRGFNEQAVSPPPMPVTDWKGDGSDEDWEGYLASLTPERIDELREMAVKVHGKETAEQLYGATPSKESHDVKNQGNGEGNLAGQVLQHDDGGRDAVGVEVYHGERREKGRPAVETIGSASQRILERAKKELRGQAGSGGPSKLH